MALLVPHLERIDLPLRFQIEAPNRSISHVYFPEDGLVSVVASGARETIEVGVVGRDGVTGHAVLLGSDRSPNAMHMQIAGQGSRIAADALRAALLQSETMTPAFLAYAQAFLTQVSHTVLANGRAKLEARLARWLLMAHDRLDDDKLSLTHEFLAVMLGVRRPGVTVALQKLEISGLIETQRNAITIKDRKQLEIVADGYYSLAEAEQERLTGWISLHRD